MHSRNGCLSSNTTVEARMSGTGRKRARRKIVYRGSAQNRFSMILVVIVMAAILIAVSVRGVYLNSKLAEYNAQIEELQDEIESENARTEEIEEYAKYVQTDEYIEEVARDKLGLVREGEIIFRNDGEADADSSGTASDETAETEEDDTEETSSGTQTDAADTGEADALSADTADAAE